MAPGPAPWWEARRLLRRTRAATLATQLDGQPFASLVTPASAGDGSLLMLLSGLSEHTRHLRAEPRCSLLLAGEADGPNPQTAPRLSVTGLARPEPDPALKRRWVSLHPYAAFYADLPDFTLWRVAPLAASFVGGFARAFRLRAADLQPDPDAVAALDAAEAGILGHCNADHADALALIAERSGGPPGDWRMVAADPDGFDLALDETVLRVAWSAPVSDGGGVRRELVRLVGEARAAAGG